MYIWNKSNQNKTLKINHKNVKIIINIFKSNQKKTITKKIIKS